MSTDYIYWTFTAAAQCVATFVALLLTGYALVLAQIDAARERDDSLQEIHDALRKSYHGRLTTLAWLTAAAVGLSLLVVWINRSDQATPGPLIALAAATDVVAMVVGLAFVVAIIDPEKYQKAAERALEGQNDRQGDEQRLPALEFFRSFRKLERQARDACRRASPDPDSEPARQASLRSLADQLLQADVVDEALHGELLALARYRNLLFHGDLQQAEPAMIERVRQATGQLRKLASPPRAA